MRLGDVCDVRTGATVRNRAERRRVDGVLAIQQSDISAEGVFDRRDAIRLDASASPKHFVAPDEVLVCSRALHWAACVPGDIGEPLLAVAPLFVLKPVAGIFPDYLAWCINRSKSREYFNREAMGTGVKMITKSVLQDLQVDLPVVSVQRAIVEAARSATREFKLSRRRAEVTLTLRTVELERVACGAGLAGNGSAE